MRNRKAGKRIDLYHLIKLYNELDGNARKVNVDFIKKLDLDELDEEIRKVRDFIGEIQYFEPKIKKYEEEQARLDAISLTERKLNDKALRLQDIEDRLMGRRTRRANDLEKSAGRSTRPNEIVKINNYAKRHLSKLVRMKHNNLVENVSINETVEVYNLYEGGYPKKFDCVFTGDFYDESGIRVGFEGTVPVYLTDYTDSISDEILQAKITDLKKYPFRLMRRSASDVINDLENRIARLEKSAGADEDMAYDLVLTLNEDRGYSKRVKGIAEKIKEDMDFKMFDKRKALGWSKGVLVNFVRKYEKELGVKVDRQTLDLASKILCEENIKYVKDFGYTLE